LDTDHAAVRRVVPWVLCLVIGANGCQGTRLPNVVPTQYDADKRSFNVHDPLPETDIAPDMAARPRGFNDEWAEPRRTQQGQALIGVPPGGTNSAPPPQQAVPMGAPAVGLPIAPGSAPNLNPDQIPQ
jgi:hypothetical protein